MEFINLKAQYKRLETEINDNIKKALEKGAFIMGEEVRQLEGELAEFVGVKHCITCANGTDALQMALMAFGIGEGDAVFVPTFTFMSTAEVVSLVGATPVFVDILPETFNMDTASLEAAIELVEAQGKLRPAAIIPVDLFGQCADFNKILPIAKSHNLKVIEDGAQGFGGAINGKRACSFGDISTTSFFPAKPLGCYGDGGAVFTDDDELAALLASIRIHGKGSEKYDNVRIGLNSRLDTIQAAVLLPKLHAFAADELELRDKWALLYTELLSGSVKTPQLPEGFTSSWAQYTILLDSAEQRNALQAALKERGIPAMIYYPRPLHRQTAFLNLGWEKGSLPAAESVCERVLSLPMHPYLDEETVHCVADAVKECLANI